MHSPGVASFLISCLPLVMSKHLFRLVRKSVQTIFFRDTFLKFYNELVHLRCFEVVQYYSANLLIIMSSPGQKRGSCGRVMALFHNHKKCARCREKGVGDDPCVKKLDCQICKAFTPAQIQQLSTPTYKARKECAEQKKTGDVEGTTSTLVDPTSITVLGQVSSEKASSVESTPKHKKRRSDIPPGLVNGNTAPNLLQTTSNPLMTSGVRDFPVSKLCC